MTVAFAHVHFRADTRARIILGTPPAGRAATVRVVDSAGAPVAGVRLRLEGLRVGGDAFEPPSALVTGEDGEAIARDLRAGDARIALLAERTTWVLDQPLFVDPVVESEAVVVHGERTIRGVLRGQAFGPCPLRYVEVEGPDRSAFAVLEGDGTFTFRGAVAGSYRLRFLSHPLQGGLSLEMTVEVSDTADPPAIELDQDRIAVLDVAAGDGERWPEDVTVSCFRGANGANGETVELHRVSRGDRRVRYAAYVAPGEYRVVVQRQGGESEVRVVGVGARERVVVGVE